MRIWMGTADKSRERICRQEPRAEQRGEDDYEHTI